MEPGPGLRTEPSSTAEGWPLQQPNVRDETVPLPQDVNPLRYLLFGRPLETWKQDHTRLPKILALPVFSSDAISSVAYATQQVLLILGAAGLWTASQHQLYTRLNMGITIGIVVLLAVVATSYWQTIFGYPSGGGSYIVSKDNLGTTAGLVAGAALLIDYVLTVSVSVASGVQNLLSTPIMAAWSDHLVAFCFGFIVLLTLANLRGQKESGVLFAVPTYLFIGSAALLIVLGILGPFMGWTLHTDAVNQTVPDGYGTATALTTAGLSLLLLKAFANGCCAMTGVEAVSNGIPAFKRPESRNAALTLIAMACILGFLFLGTGWLAATYHVVYWEKGDQTAPPVIDQLSALVFGKSESGLRLGLYYLMQLSTTAILVLAANTSYADFPRLSSIMARDRFLPKQLSSLGDRLVFSNGIVLLGLFSVILIVLYHGQVDNLIPLYAIGVFTAFTMSQSGMVVHWLRERSRGWQTKMIINGLGAFTTAIVLLDIVSEKFMEGAWIVVVLVAAMFVMFLTIRRHYDRLSRGLSLEQHAVEPSATPLVNRVLVLVPTLNVGIMQAIAYARTICGDVTGLHIETSPESTELLKVRWHKYVGPTMPLVVLPSPYRSMLGPLLVYIQELLRKYPDGLVTVVVSELVPSSWWHSFLHRNDGLFIKFYLLNQPRVVVANVRYFEPQLSDTTLSFTHEPLDGKTVM